MNRTHDTPARRPPSAEDTRAAGDATVLDNHRLMADGPVWLCVHCKGTWPHPQPLPVPAAPCVLRRWGDQS